MNTPTVNLVDFWKDIADWPGGKGSVSPILGCYARELGDILPDNLKERAKALIPRLIGIATDGQEKARGYLAVDWFIRRHTHDWLWLVPELRADAARLTALTPMTTREDTDNVKRIVKEIASHASASAVSARVTSAGSAWDIARLVAEQEMRATGKDAVWSALWAHGASFAVSKAVRWDNARNAAHDAATVVACQAAQKAMDKGVTEAAVRAAAKKSLALVVDELQKSAIRLFEQMIDPDGYSSPRA